jgi:hypothetical protein
VLPCKGSGVRDHHPVLPGGGPLGLLGLAVDGWDQGRAQEVVPCLMRPGALVPICLASRHEMLVRMGQAVIRLTR